MKRKVNFKLFIFFLETGFLLLYSVQSNNLIENRVFSIVQYLYFKM